MEIKYLNHQWVNKEGNKKILDLHDNGTKTNQYLVDEAVLARSLQKQITMFLKNRQSLSGYIYKTIPAP